MANDQTPDWMREAVVAVHDEITRFATTAAGFSLHPGRFASGWRGGQIRALNPVAYLSTSVAITAALNSLLLGADSSGLWAALANSTLPHTYYVLLGVLCHALLRLGGSTCALRGSAAIALFAGGGPGLVQSLCWTVQVKLHTALVGSFRGEVMRGIPAWSWPIFWLLSLGPLVFVWLTLALGLRGLHRVGRSRVALAIAFALVSSGALLSVLHGYCALRIPVPHFVLGIVGDQSLIDVWFGG